MGFYLGYALSLYGREQDRLSHVLVSEPYERIPQFFYPTPGSVQIHTHDPDSRPYDARDAKVTLAEIPFVRLREGLNPELMEGTASFSAVVADAQRALPPLALDLDPANCTVTAGGESFRMKPAWFATYWMLAERARLSKLGVHDLEDGVAKERLGYYGRVVGTKSEAYKSAEERYGNRFTGDNFNPDKANIKKVLVEHLGLRRAEPYLIKQQDRAPIPGKRIHRFGLALPSNVIRITDDEVAEPENTGGHQDDRRQEKP